MTEVVRELAGLHPGDAPEMVDDALAALVARAESAESERAWLRTRLSVLADVTGGEGQVPVAEVASAAARVLEASAADRPLVLTIEDLHWSEPALRDVLSAIVDDADAPLVVLCTARPELFDTDAAWGGGRANSTTIRLAPLSDEETSALVETLLATAIRTESERERVLRNIGGNPLFAIEYVRMLTDTLEVVEADMPVSVQAVIGARLDSVAPPIRAVLQDAAVVGARFWPDALATVGDAEDVRGALAELARRGLIVRSTDLLVPRAGGVRVQPHARPRGRVRAAAADDARPASTPPWATGSRPRSASAGRSSPTRWRTISSRRCCWPTPRASGRRPTPGVRAPPPGC